MKVKEEVEEWKGEEEQVQEQEQQAHQQKEQDPSYGSSSIDVGSSSSSRSRLLGGGSGGRVANASGGGGGGGDEGGDTVVVCEACGADNARWYCAADDAYLCHRCDQSVHAANAVALRHERTSCFREEYAASKEEEDARRGGRSSSSSWSRSNSKRRREGWCKSNKTIKLEGHVHLRTNGDADDDEGDEEDELQAGLEQQQQQQQEEEEEEAHKVPVFLPDKHEDQSPDSVIVDCDEEAAPPAAAAPAVAEDGEVVDVERFLNSAAEYADDSCDGGGGGGGLALDGGGGGFDLDFLGFGGQQLQYFDEGFAIRRDNVPSPYIVKGEPGGGDGFDAPPPPPPPPLFAPPPPPPMAKFDDENEHESMWRQMLDSHAQRRIWLRLDYDEVLNAWHGRRPFIDQQQQRGNPTTTTTMTRVKRQPKAPVVPEDSSASDLAQGSWDVGVVPELSSGSAGGDDQQGRVPVVAPAAAVAAEGGSGGREARVTRYREKRRTRLFSKKIRYEVRKLNAERRPRLKGRFIKRSPGN